MIRCKEKRFIFANLKALKFNMETITLSYEPGSDFAVALNELIRNSEGVCVVKLRKGEKTLDGLIKEIIKNAPQDTPLTDEDIQQEVNAVRYCL